MTLLACPNEEILDLEQEFEPSLLKTKQIVIPGHPDAFNPSIVRWKEGWLLSFREMQWVENRLLSHLYLVPLDKKFRPLTLAQELETEFQSAADGRLLFCGEELYLVYGNHPPPKKGRVIWRIWIARIKEASGHFTLTKPTELTTFSTLDPKKSEKNWTPFCYANELLLTYSLVPHRIFFAQLGSTFCPEFSLHPTKTSWKWGALRGGTPALLIDGHYLAFFHSAMWMSSKQSKESRSYHYFMGAYTFSSTPPFAIQSISSKPIVGPGFYSGKEYTPYWNKSIQAIFPGGIVEDGPYLWVVFGRQDHEIWLAKFHKQQLLESLAPLP